MLLKLLTVFVAGAMLSLNLAAEEALLQDTVFIGGTAFDIYKPRKRRILEILTQ